MKKRPQKKKPVLIKEHLHPLRRVEKFVDRVVPILLIILAVVVILENPFWSLVDLHTYRSQLFIFDTLLVIFLAADLTFKWWHIRNLKTFVRLYWLELIAVFPFYLFFRIYILSVEFARAGEQAQRAIHQAILTREAGLLKEAEFFQSAEKILREEGFASRLLRSIVRVYRIVAWRLESAYHYMTKASFRHKLKEGQNPGGLVAKERKKRKSSSRERNKR
ncbi:MAG TPA: hypothetical protein HA282_04170 [Nanoarchaeota archaeon]|nr:MAG: Flap endonuclease-1 [archaeon GW2011_AR6]MBS3082414.1 hypothetical protein [Candidatus Pacearchaeota archaeon]HIH17529.1 hypothetical protein [Nanoarchaeota archaeon]HIH34447.1 hypothetical protein [Nanoarchaeota archaeon]HIH66382.1 hypothetical protein [Nanoarchaeota archaeon]